MLPRYIELKNHKFGKSRENMKVLGAFLRCIPKIVGVIKFSRAIKIGG